MVGRGEGGLYIESCRHGAGISMRKIGTTLRDPRDFTRVVHSNVVIVSHSQ